MSKPIEPARKTILFIEDQEVHYEQVAAHLRLHGYKCRRVSRAESGVIRQIAMELKPIAAVVDFVLLSTSKSQREVDDAASAYTKGKPDSSPHDASVDKEHYGVESIPILRQLCPGIKILVYSQYANQEEVSRQATLYQADAGVPKRRDPDGNLLGDNAQEIAARVRKLIE